MKKFSFKYKTEIYQPLNKVFDFYSDPKNINLLTPGFIRVTSNPDKKYLKMKLSLYKYVY